MDLQKFDTVQASDQGHEVRLFNPATGEDFDLYITVLGRDSTVHRQISNEQQKRRLHKMGRGGAMRVSAIAPQEFEQDAILLLAACTKAWRDDSAEAKEKGTTSQLTIGGQSFDCTKDNAVMLYTRYPWIREQIDAAVNDRANFTPR